MKRYIIHLIIVVACLLQVGCQKQEIQGNNGGDIDLSKVAEVTLTGVELFNGDAHTRATASAPMPVGSQFRMYVFKKGVTDIAKLILTTTYTIKNQAGYPVSDSTKKLFLPIGELDVYLVGPVQHITTERPTDGDGNPILDEAGNPIVNTTTYDIAAVNGVTPTANIDLVSSLTTIKVEAGANQFQATPLSHRMARMDVIVTRSTEGVKYENLSIKTISVSNQASDAYFTFNDQGGTITETEEGYLIHYPQITEEIKGERFKSSLMLFPRKPAHMRIAVHFTCQLKKADGTTSEIIDRRLESGIIKDKALPAGKITEFETSPTVSGELLFRTRVLPWIDVDLPVEEVPIGNDLLFSYSGLDAPYTLDGKLYWKDRSGHGRDAQLVGDIRYDKEGRYYYAAADGAYIRIPELGKVPIYTLELVAESAGSPIAVPAQFGTETATSLKVMLPSAANQVSFNSGTNTFLHSFFVDDKGYMNNLATYAFARDNSRMNVSRNGAATGAEKSVSEQVAPVDFKENKLLYWGSEVGNNSMTHLKLYAARLTRKYLAPKSPELMENYRNDISVYAKTDVNADVTKQNYIKNGLILNLDGTQANATINSVNVWPDLSDMKNHAQIFDGVVRESNYYKFNGTNSYMRLLNTLGTLQNYTIEFVIKPASTGTTNTLFQFTSIAKQNTNRDFYLSFQDNVKKVNIETPAKNGRGEDNIWSNLTTDFPYASVIGQYQYSITRSDGRNSNGVNVSQCGVPVVSNSVPTTTPVNEMRYCYIGQDGKDGNFFNGQVYAIRVYNRVLSDKERQINYQIDKAKYSLLP